MLSNPRAHRIRELRQLLKRNVREKKRQFLVEGAQAVREALRAHGEGITTVLDLFVAEGGDPSDELRTRAVELDVRVHDASVEVVAALSETVTPQGVVAVCEFLDQPLEALLVTKPRLVAVLVEVQDPGNAGSIVRAADAAGADAVIFTKGSVDPYNGKVVRATVGGLFHVPIVVSSWGIAVDELRSEGLQVLATAGQGDLTLYDAQSGDRLNDPTAWLFGNEANGLSSDIQAQADAVVSIPIFGQAESLNVATVAAMCLYESAKTARA